MVRMAAGTIVRHRFEKVLINPEQVISSMETLCGFLAKTYGKAVKIEHELPFRDLCGGQMMVGSIDFVWYTSDKECVLVDFKNLPFVGRDVLEPENKRYVGKYAPQQKAYRDALVRDGLAVKACLLYLAMQGRVIELCG